MGNFPFCGFDSHQPYNNVAYMRANVPAKLMHIKHKNLFTLGNRLAVLCQQKRKERKQKQTTTT